MTFWNPFSFWSPLSPRPLRSCSFTGVVLLLTVFALPALASNGVLAGVVPKLGVVIKDQASSLVSRFATVLRLNLSTDWINQQRILIMTIAALCGIGPVIRWATSKPPKDEKFDGRIITPKTVDTQHIIDNTHLESFKTTKHTYPSIRIYHHLHKKAAKLPPNLPLIVFLHGLGGQIGQFQYLLEYFVNVSHVLSVDLPGCGGSEMLPKDWEAYSTAAFTELVGVIVERYLDPEQQFIVVGHSMGCSVLATLLGSGNPDLAERCIGYVGICPKAQLSDQEKKQRDIITSLPRFVFDTYRFIDRRGGVDSPSVKRFVSPSSPKSIREYQLLINERSRTPTALRVLKGFVTPSPEVWQNVRCPILLITAQHDHATPPSNADTIASYFSSLPQERKNKLKQVELPDAGHGVLYEKYHHVCHVVAEFFTRFVSEQLSLAWQLESLKEGKWILKNEKKWMMTSSVSGKIGTSMFKAMKTLRQNDPIHNPQAFIEANPDVAHIVDISYEDPPYIPSSFQGSHITYHKFSTKSKLPPTLDQVSHFIELIDAILAEHPLPPNPTSGLIAVHCHYGFNRTGLFICSYLIEKLGYGVQEAIDAFKEARYPGIRHHHFIDELFVRYDSGPDGIIRAPTF
ncbi:hypothetical protein H072_1622 [Dactylellina haptotyla CBS 200.50]|uniref:Tyrosine specific protein phosphatases domain-containing protein n=1 Tax=Dactylellina haptotyla (strain CBS 200.50) TaxID=1284197 RepID=S8BY60_DACHA|nr:hypothetical protein H072_1622 [Dactylellina haptotyla CBS 200.50]